MVGGCVVSECMTCPLMHSTINIRGCKACIKWRTEMIHAYSRFPDVYPKNIRQDREMPRYCAFTNQRSLCFSLPIVSRYWNRRLFQKWKTDRRNVQNRRKLQLYKYVYRLSRALSLRIHKRRRKNARLNLIAILPIRSFLDHVRATQMQQIRVFSRTLHTLLIVFFFSHISRSRFARHFHL